MTIVPITMDTEEDHQPTNMVFSKMETLVKAMQHADTGVPVRCQKVFLTTIPCAFTGTDLVEWLMDKLCIDDVTEAIHLASLLCQYGYTFPVTDSKTLNVKDDGTLYRFQSPYFWPSQNWEPDNVDYAIYLAKRSMRNKQRHGLEEYEQGALIKLQKMLCDKWDFVYMQAEEQVRLAKERKKADKVVLDSQERAFWRVHRPSPCHPKSLEEGIRRNFARRNNRRKNVESIKKEIDLLKRLLKQPRMKESKAVESLLTHCEQYEEHDPFLSTAQPSNPWVSDDTAMWVLNSVRVETPTERRVKLWGFSLRELLADLTGRQEFETFLEKEYSGENLRFWLAVEELKALPQSQVEEKVNDIYREYIESGAPCEINIDSKTMEETLHCLKKPSRYTFDAAQSHIFLLMKKDSYARFLRSDQYKNLLATAINPCPKKKFWFGQKKKSPNPSPKNKRRGSTSSTLERQQQSSTRLSQHSYSTGNLHEIDAGGATDRSNKSSPYGSTGDMKNHEHHSNHEHNKSSLSPSSLRKKLNDLVSGHSKAHRKNSCNLEVPKHYSVQTVDIEEKENTNLSIAVPNTKLNLVAPWESEST